MALLSQVAPTVQSTGDSFTPPVIQVRQTGGVTGRFDTRPVIEVACFGNDYPEAKVMARDCSRLMLAFERGGGSVSGVEGHDRPVFVDRITSAVTPREIPYEDPGKRRKTATYTVTMRRPR